MKKLLTLMFIYISTFNVLVFSQEGNLDTSFIVGSGANGEINSIAVQPDGKILIGGVFVNYNGTSINRLARLNSNGSLDNTFNIGTGPSGIVNKIKVLPSGKIFISGIISSYNGVSCNFIVKLNSDGSKDNSFNVYHVAHQSSPANDFYILPDGKILLAGLINNFNGTGLRTLIKLNADGSLDTSFNQGGSGFEANISSVSPYISTIDLQSDGKIIVGGLFRKFNGTIVNYLARLNPDGSLDTSFQTGNTVYSGPSNEVTAIKVLDDDKILVGGKMSTYNGSTVNYLMRLNSNGSLDNTFSVSNALNSGVSIATPKQIVTQLDNKIIVVGDYTTINSYPARSFVRYNQNGALDINFNNGMGTGPNGSLSACAIQEDGKILIGGVHTRYDGTLINRISRINNGVSLDAIDFNATSSNTFIYPNPANQFLFVSSKINFTEYLIMSQDGKIIETNVLNSSFSIPIDHLNNGLYFIKLKGNDTNYFTKFIKE